MPVTAKFSKEFYDRLGHKIADELVEWFNAVDAIYRSEFRELFELHFGRFDAKLEQRTAELRAELRAEIRQEISKLETTLTERMATLETRLLRWAFMFGIAALGAIAGMIRLFA